MDIEYIVYVLKKNLDQFDKENSMKTLLSLLIPENKGLQRCLIILYKEDFLVQAKDYQYEIVNVIDEDDCDNCYSQEEKSLKNLVEHFFLVLTRDYAITETIAFSAIKIWLKVLEIYDESTFIDLGIDNSSIIGDVDKQLYFIDLGHESQIVSVDVNSYYSFLYKVVNDPLFITYDFVISYFEEHIKTLVDKVVNTLTDREQSILRMRFGLESGIIQSYEEIAQDFDLSIDRIHQIEKKALKKLSHPSRSRLFQCFKYEAKSGKVNNNKLPIDYGKRIESWLREEIAYSKEGHSIDYMLFSKFIKKHFLKHEDSFTIESLKDFDISVRSYNCLVRNGVKTIGDLMSYSTEDLMRFRNLGRICFEEVESIRIQIRKQRDSESITLKVIENALINDNDSASGLDDLLITRALINPKFMMSLLLEGFMTVNEFLTYYRGSREQILPSISDEIEMFKELIPDYTPMLCVSVPDYVKDELDELEINTLEDLEIKRNSLSNEAKLVMDSIKLKYHYAKEWLEEIQ
ncbi:DNA-directed RNA polymerase subunit alpha C-terminal domain-containing protein [Butyrivibrio fibrisolvens]|uniref:DNA-directed RNA polymerase subunit alpha C-terminal domain-containing protein n=1 Tax=Butyrivibrio fibrisolvens TaxID=831 RepID=UPI0004287337|nr:DNA-directed RNA polymerase subunit alpha C-terminal domain-containing protein [Butyrivibrio fibrisolvens]